MCTNSYEKYYSTSLGLGKEINKWFKWFNSDIVSTYLAPRYHKYYMVGSDNWDNNIFEKLYLTHIIPFFIIYIILQTTIEDYSIEI